MRLIDADALKKEFPHDEDWDYPVNTNSLVVETIDNAPTIDAVSQWILCSERLPKYRETVIATNRWHDGVDIVFRDAIQEDGTDDRWVFPLDDDAYCAIEDFIAWMPLPKPYMGERKTMSDYIKREDAVNVMYTFLKQAHDMDNNDDRLAEVLTIAKNVVHEIPSADVVEVVRCKDCKWMETNTRGGLYCNYRYGSVRPYDFCSCGERKEDD